MNDFRHARKGVPHLKVSGKGSKTRYLPLHPGTHGLINDYLDAAEHSLNDSGALFRPVRNNRTGRLEDAITADGVYRLVRRYSGQLAFLIGAHALRATAATDAAHNLPALIDRHASRTINFSLCPPSIAFCTSSSEIASRGNVAIGLELRIDRNQIVRSADLDAVPGIIDDGPIGGVRLPRERFQRGNHAFAVEIIRSKRYSRNNRSGERSCSSPKRPAVGRARNRWGSGRCQGALQVRLTDSGRGTTGARRAHFEPKPSKKGKIFQRQSNLGVSWSPPSS